MTEALRAAVEHHGGVRAHVDRRSPACCATASGCAACASPTAPRSPRRSSCRRATRAARSSSGSSRRRAGGGDHRPLVARRRPRGLRVEDRRRASTPCPGCATATTTSARRSRSPRRWPRWTGRPPCCATGDILERPAMFVNVPSLVDPSVAPDGPPRVQPRGAADPVPPSRRLAGSTEPRRWLRAVRRPLRARLPRVDRRLAGDDPGRVRARLPPPRRPRHQLRRRAAGRAAPSRPGADALRDGGARARTSPARRRSPAPASGAPADATAPPSSSAAREVTAPVAWQRTRCSPDRSRSAGSPARHCGSTGARSSSPSSSASGWPTTSVRPAPPSASSPSSSRSSCTSWPTPSSPAGSASARRRSSCGASAGSPASTASRARRGPRAGSPPPDRWPACSSASPRSALAYAVHRAGGPDGVILVVGGLGVPQRRCSACSTCCRARRSTAGASCAPCGGRRHGDRYRAMREVGQRRPDHRLGARARSGCR